MADIDRGAKILIVEDSPTQREELRSLLEGAGFAVIAANDGKEGLAVARANTVDLVVSDIVMPEMDGYALCQALREDRTQRHVPVILLTSLTDPRDVIRGLEAGANNFVCKPYAADYLLARVESVLATAKVRRTAGAESGPTIRFRDKQYCLSQERLQVLEVLLAAFDDAVYELPARTDRTSSGSRVLVVEDSPTQLERARFVLEECGCSVVAVANGRDALDAIAATDFDLVLSDVVMPELDGYALCRAIRAGERHPAVPVILLTALTDPQEVIAGLEAGATHFIRKPCSDRHLAARVTALLAGRSPSGGSAIPLPIDIVFEGQRHAVTADREQMLDLLLSSYGSAVQQKAEVARVRDELRVLNEQLEARIAAREQQHASILRTAMDGFWLVDTHGRISEVNETYCAMSGYSADELRTMRIDDLEALETTEDVAVRIQRIVARGEDRFESWHRRKDGSSFPVEVSVQLRPVDGGQLVVFLHDITERKRAAEANERFRVGFEQGAVGQALVSLDGRFSRVNEALARMLGYASTELQGMTFSDVTHPDDRRIGLDAMNTLLAGAGSARFEKRYLARDGAVVWVDGSAALVRDPGGQPLHYVTTLVDITQRKRAQEERAKLEDQLRASQKMEAIGSLAGGVAHDFNNLLSVILSYTEFALETHGDGDPLRDDLLEIKKAGERAADLTRQLLAFSRKQVLQPVPLSLNAIASGLERMLRRILGEDIDLVLHLAPDLGVVRADPSQLEQVLMNLVINARDAMPEGGKLTIETADLDLDEEYAACHVDVTPGPYVLLAVTDTGFGMDDQTRARIFDPFFTTKGPGKGTGLGLSTVYGIVKQSAGNILVYSEPGRGTTFKIYLPRAASATATPAKRPSVPVRATGTETVLVVEDEAPLRRVARRTLEAAGYRVLTAADGDEALAVSARHEGDIHLLLADVVMPRMGGRVLADRLSETRPGLEVVYMSGYTDNAIVHHGVVDAGTHFIGKPFTAADLTRKVWQVLDGRTDFRAADRDRPAQAQAEETDRPVDERALRALPREVLAALRKAVVAARYDEIVELVERIRATEPGVAAALRRMAEEYDYAAMRDALGGTEDPNRSP